MPKVSDDYRDARRREILDAARRCFARDGFHQTSMQDVFGESGLSAGAVYRYFPGKAAMIVAIAEENMSFFARMLREATNGDDDRPIGELVADVLEAIRLRHRETCVGGIALTVWAEAVRDPGIAEALNQALKGVRAPLVALVEQQQHDGRLPVSVAADALAASLLAMVPGYIMQLTLYGDAAVAGVPDAVRAMWR